MDPATPSNPQSSKHRYSTISDARQRTLDAFIQRSARISPAKTPLRQTQEIPSSSPPGFKTAVSQLQVVLSSPGPAHLTYNKIVNLEDDVDELVISDLSSRYKKKESRTQDGPSPPPAAKQEQTHHRQTQSAGATRASRQTLLFREKKEQASSTRGRPGRPRKLVTADANTTGAAKRRGRVPKQPSPSPRTVYDRIEPKFVRFICEWSKCKAQLHNMVTLRKHIDVVHCRTVPFICEWRKCANQIPPPNFQSIDELKSHIEKQHLTPFVWHVGDGPAVGCVMGPLGIVADGNPDYLMDKQGNQVTPSIRNQEVEDFITWRNNRRKLRELLLRRDQNPSNMGDDD
jgi:hypothetical protein